MNYEEKYIELVGKIKKAYLYAQTDSTRAVLEGILPELAESEDERIRKKIIAIVKSQKEQQCHIDGAAYDKMITWLEKQGEQILANSAKTCKVEPKSAEWNKEDEQNLNVCISYIPDEYLRRWLKDAVHVKYDKPADKAEPKFHEGNWIVDSQGLTHQIERVVENVTTHTFGYDIVGGGYFNDDNENAHLWTIQDAKEGDVLCCESGWTCIFKTLNSNNISFSSYCFMDNTGWFCETGSDGHTLDENFIKAYNGKIYPTTKEQRDLLFQKMKEAGYEWDAEKKELKKPQRMISAEAKEALYNAPAWSEEDERILNGLISSLARIGANTRTDSTSINYTFPREINWLKSLKGRVQPQNRWKPSKEQMSQLKWIAHQNADNIIGKELMTLYEDLKKLTE